MKDDASRPATPGEIEEMRALVHADMQAPRTDDACNASHRLRGYPGRSGSCQQCPARKWELPHPAGHTAEEVQTELARVIADPMVTVSRVAPVWPAGKMPPPDIRIINAAEQIGRKYFPGVPIIPAAMIGATDAIFLNGADKPIYGSPGLWANPDGNGLHGLNERIEVRELFSRLASF